MNWLDRFTQHYNNYASHRYKDRVAATEKANQVLDAPQRALKEAISGDPNSWGLPDFSYEGPVGKSGERVATYTDEGLEPVLDVLVDPLNVVGAGVAGSGARTARALTGSLSSRGNTTGAAKNYIDNFYNQQATMPERVKSFVEWGADGVRRAIEQTVDPRARALYREQGINSAMRDTAQRAVETGASRDTAKAVAQVQASGTLIPDQAGRVGPKAQAVKDLEARSFLTSPVPAKTGAYKELIKDNKLKGQYESGKTAAVSDKDLDIIDDHVGKVWKDRSGRPLRDSPGGHIRIKNAGAGDQVSGAHHADFIRKSGVVQSLGKLFKDGKNHSLQELHDILSKSERVKIHPRSKTMEDVKENGLWVTGSFTGTAITEGGVNYIAKVSPNGRVTAVVSDEHNFLEKLPVVGKGLETVLPNRSVSITPPMHFDLKKSKAKIKSVQPENKANVKESLLNLAEAEPSKEMLAAERNINRGATMVGAGMLTGGNREEQR